MDSILEGKPKPYNIVSRCIKQTPTSSSKTKVKFDILVVYSINIYQQLSWLAITVNLTQPSVIREEKPPLRDCQDQVGPWVTSFLRQVVLDYRRKLGKQKPWRRPTSACWKAEFCLRSSPDVPQ